MMLYLCSIFLLCYLPLLVAVKAGFGFPYVSSKQWFLMLFGCTEVNYSLCFLSIRNTGYVLWQG